ncbi:Hypothetical protein R9X50_00588300 [Acrodontium crateriforme]|uniref:non-specific serine/threonine protein kinase n=1 Tax=Acrodontium crateriforme TaxID=150365 RepID=A0AAQ3M7X0_9PEZI|nr:Hypothetical protein R9X50_00588300 [Acrodontium crateriforme]
MSPPRALGPAPSLHDAAQDEKKLDGGSSTLCADDYTTRAGSPNEPNSLTTPQNAPILPNPILTNLDTTVAHRPGKSPLLSAGLSIKTDMAPPELPSATKSRETPTINETHVSESALLHHSSLTSPVNISGGAASSLRSNLSTASMTSSLSPSLPSPYLAAMTDLTPLPSPLVSTDAPAAPWRRPIPGTPTRSRQSSLEQSMTTAKQSPASPSKRTKPYGHLIQEVLPNPVTAQETAQASGCEEMAHSRNRSVSEFVPEALQNVRPRHVTFGPGDAANMEVNEYRMQREAHLAAQRGLASPASIDIGKQIPTPPPSNASVAESDDAEDEAYTLEDGTPAEYLQIHCGIHNKRRKFRQLRQLGQGTFSKVMLATRWRMPSNPTPDMEPTLDQHRLVAVKIVQHGPAGGADEARIETSLKREVEMLKSVSHPSLIHLRACEYQDTRTLLVLTYCPGGDLFEFASERRNLLTPPVIQRMFSELVSAVRYLHTHWIVHRDIKLENVLVNLPHSSLASLLNPLSHPTPLVTLTDLGLSRRIPEPPEPPTLTTRCGSEDYAAPEILLGQPYDGRLTDAWALGVLLYALMEGRLPFDAPPGKPDRSRNTHRIARADWIWCRFGDKDGEWDSSARDAKSFEGARMVVESLLKKVRMGRQTLETIEPMEWVQKGIDVQGGLQLREEDEEEEM